MRARERKWLIFAMAAAVVLAVAMSNAPFRGYVASDQIDYRRTGPAGRAYHLNVRRDGRVTLDIGEQHHPSLTMDPARASVLWRQCEQLDLSQLKDADQPAGERQIKCKGREFRWMGDAAEPLRPMVAILDSFISDIEEAAG
jgi:hypothetical protein